MAVLGLNTLLPDGGNLKLTDLSLKEGAEPSSTLLVSHLEMRPLSLVSREPVLVLEAFSGWLL